MTPKRDPDVVPSVSVTTRTEPSATTADVARRPPRSQGAIAGVLSLAMGLGVAQLVAGFWADGKNPVVGMGDWVIDHVPPGVKDWAIQNFGTNDKLALIVGTVIILVLLSIWLGHVAQRRLGPALVGIGVISVVGVLASLDHARATWASASAVADRRRRGRAVAGLAERLAARGAARRDAAPAERAAAGRPHGSRSTRLLRVGGRVIGAGAAMAGGLGQALRRRYAVSGQRAALVLRGRVRHHGRPRGNDLGIAGQQPFITPNADFYRIDTVT